MGIQVGQFVLRPDQERTIEKVRSAVSECRRAGIPARVLVQAPCGAGKTILSSTIMKGCLERGNPTAFIVSGRQLVTQKAEKLEACGVPHSILMDGFEYHHSQVTVCSFHTYLARVMDRGTVPSVNPAVWIVDEAHNFKSDLALSIVSESEAVIGFTATPINGQTGRGLGGFWTKLVIGPTHQELLRLGVLCPPRIFAPWTADLSTLSLGETEWSQEAVSKLYNQKVLVGDVVRDWKKHGMGRPTVCCASSVEHSLALRDEFREAGITAEHIDADTPADERAGYFAAIQSGSLQVLTNFAVITTGVDLPCLGCGILAFATNSLVKYLQVCGRLFRAFPGKTDCILIDHGANVDRHGWPTEDREWTLDDSKSMRELDVLRREREKKPREPICCPKCGAMRDSGPKCTNCGHQHTRTGLRMRMQDGSLKEIKRRKPKRKLTNAQKDWMGYLAICARKDRPYSAACVMFRNVHGMWPEKAGVSPLAKPSDRSMRVGVLWPGFLKKRNEPTYVTNSTEKHVTK